MADKIRPKGILLGLVQYVLTLLYIRIFIKIEPSAHFMDDLYLTVNFLILSAIVIIPTIVFKVKFDLKRRDILSEMITLFVCFLVYQIGGFYFLILVDRAGFLWDDLNIYSFLGASLTAVSYALLSAVTVVMVKFFKDEIEDRDMGESEASDVDEGV